MTEDNLKYIVARLIVNANDARSEFLSDMTDDFQSGRSEAYYEMLDTIKSELEVSGADLKEFGLDIDLEKTYL